MSRSVWGLRPRPRRRRACCLCVCLRVQRAAVGRKPDGPWRDRRPHPRPCRRRDGQEQRSQTEVPAVAGRPCQDAWWRGGRASDTGCGQRCPRRACRALPGRHPAGPRSRICHWSPFYTRRSRGSGRSEPVREGPGLQPHRARVAAEEHWPGCPRGGSQAGGLPPSGRGPSLPTAPRTLTWVRTQPEGHRPSGGPGGAPSPRAVALTCQPCRVDQDAPQRGASACLVSPRCCVRTGLVPTA